MQNCHSEIKKLVEDYHRGDAREYDRLASSTRSNPIRARARRASPRNRSPRWKANARGSPVPPSYRAFLELLQRTRAILTAAPTPPRRRGPREQAGCRRRLDKDRRPASKELAGANPFEIGSHRQSNSDTHAHDLPGLGSRRSPQERRDGLRRVRQHLEEQARFKDFTLLSCSRKLEVLRRLIEV